jgi:5'-methylthioadenosine phosphorylase
MLGIIGGTGIYSISHFEKRNVSTPFGFAEASMGEICGTRCAFISRHGEGHAIPPHRINFRANVWALRRLGADCVLATYACGAISRFRPGDFICANDFLGLFTPCTFYDDFREGVRHTDSSEPFSPEHSKLLRDCGKKSGARIHEGGIVATTSGPRFETPSEIRALKGLGANLVSMTNAYEASLLLEAEIPCAALCIATNYAAGVSSSRLSHSEVAKAMSGSEAKINSILCEFAKALPEI